MLTKDIQTKSNKLVHFIPEGDFYFNKGVESFKKRKFDIALKWLKKAVESSPNEPVYQCQMSIIYTEIGAYYAANQILTEVLSSHGESYVDCYYLIANNYAHLGLLQDAKKYTNLYLEKAPDGDLREEAEDLLLILDIDDDVDDWALDAEDDLLMLQESIFYHLERRQWKEAIPLLEEMMVEFPDYIAAKHEYNFALFFAGEKERAIKLEQALLKENPDSLYGHNNLAIFYYERKDIKNYQKYIKAIENVYPIHEQQKLRVANTLARTGNYQQAYHRFQVLNKQKLKGHLSYYKWFSITAYHVGKQDEAILLWDEGSNHHPLIKQTDYPWLHE